jgi:periplasmic divalent cation tolerance protein
MSDEVNNGSAVVVMITTSSRAEAVRLAELLVGERLAACVQILPKMESIYRWQGEIKRDAEFLILVKTTQVNLDDLMREVRAQHSYETPEIIALPIIHAFAPYLSWLNENVKSRGIE